MLSAGTVKKVNFLTPYINIAQKEAYSAAQQVQEVLKPFIGLKVLTADRSWINKVHVLMPKREYKTVEGELTSYQFYTETIRTDYNINVKCTVIAPNGDSTVTYIYEEYNVAKITDKGLASITEIKPREEVFEVDVLEAITKLEKAKEEIHNAWSAIPLTLRTETGITRD